MYFFSALDVKGSNLTAQNDFTFDQDKTHCDVFIFGHKDFERVQAKWGIKTVPHCVATSSYVSFQSVILIMQNNDVKRPFSLICCIFVKVGLECIIL